MTVQGVSVQDIGELIACGSRGRYEAAPRYLMLDFTAVFQF